MRKKKMIEMRWFGTVNTMPFRFPRQAYEKSAASRHPLVALALLHRHILHVGGEVPGVAEYILHVRGTVSIRLVGWRLH